MFTRNKPHTNVNNNNNNNKPWFGSDCHKARCTYNLEKSKYKRNRSLNNKVSLRNASYAYKRTMNKFISKHKEITARKLRNLKAHKPKEYWSYLNRVNKKTHRTLPPYQICMTISKT